MSTEPGPTKRRIGFVLVRNAGAPRSEAFFNQIIAGLDDVLAETDSELVVRAVNEIADEITVYRQWSAGATVDAVVVKDLRVDDRRHDLLTRLALPHVLLTDTTHGGSFPAVRIDNGRGMRDAVGFLLRLGHRRLARVSGPTSLVHTVRRSEVFEASVAAAGATATVIAADYSVGGGEQATADLLADVVPPTAIVYDNDLMALGGLRAAASAGVDVPGQLSLLAWDDSVECQLATPALTALSHDVHEMGVQLGRALLRLPATGTPLTTEASRLIVVERGSTTFAPTAAPGSDVPPATTRTVR